MLTMSEAIERSGEKRAAFYVSGDQSIMVRSDFPGLVYGISFHKAFTEESQTPLEVICTSEEQLDSQLTRWAQEKNTHSHLRTRRGWYPLGVWATASLAVGSVTERAKQTIEEALHGEVRQVSAVPALYLVTFRYFPGDIENNDLQIWNNGEIQVNHSASVTLLYEEPYTDVLKSRIETFEDQAERIEAQERQREEEQSRKAQRQAREAKAAKEHEEAHGDLEDHPF